MPISEIILYLCLLSAFIAYIIYIRLIIKDKIKPHGITYLVWVLILGLNFLVQLTSGVGVSSFFIGLNFLGCIIIFILCYQKGYINYDKLDWVCFVLALLAIVLWIIAKTPIYSVVLSCIIDLLAIIPSFRKSFKEPMDDSTTAYWTSSLEYGLSLLSYKVFSVTVLLYPVFLISVEMSYCIFLVVRRWQLKK